MAGAFVSDAASGAPDRAVLLVEALIFASPEPVKKAAIAELMRAQDLVDENLRIEAVLAHVAARYDGHAVELVEVAGGWQFRTRPEFSSALTRVVEKPRRLSRGAMETLAIIAYHQPCTRAEIEAIRGVSLGQGILDALLEDSLIMPKGRKEVPGRPVLWATTVAFLKSFGLADLGALPRKEDLLLENAPTEVPVEVPSPVGQTEHKG
ncbi:SMC-Scp complex subunit ScpB [Gluconobacter wancherniae]|uniref:SMC-Scp complex subunit ScpB n=1 Tax=Gluconobacter wancherniae TaxID=1307955 RepID=UPI0030B222A7